MKSRSAWKGFVAGAIGGAVATFVMDMVQKLALEGTRAAESAVGPEKTYTEQEEGQLQDFQRAHERTADLVVKTAGGRLSGVQRKVAAPVTHYAFGALCGGVYGLVAEYVPAVTFGSGSAFGTSLFVGVSETVLPALGLMPAPADTPPLLHAGGLTAHAVYGTSTEWVRALVRKAL